MQNELCGSTVRTITEQNMYEIRSEQAHGDSLAKEELKQAAVKSFLNIQKISKHLDISYFQFGYFWKYDISKLETFGNTLYT